MSRMRCGIRWAVAGLAVVAALSCASAAWAGEKKLPVPDWALDAAKTPTPVVATTTNAPAVILFDEYLITVDEQNHAVERERYVVRILKPQGRDYAHCSAYYDVDSKLRNFHSWTIAADGKQFQAKDEDYSDRGLAEGAELQFTE